MQSQNLEIYLVIPNLNSGGTERVLTHFANGLVRMGFVVTIHVLTGGKCQFKLDPNIIVIDYNYSRTIFAARTILNLIFKTKKNTPILTFTTHLNILVGLILFLIPKVFRSNKVYCRESCNPTYILFDEKYSFLFKAAYKIAYNQFKAVIVQSQDMHYDLVCNWDIDFKKVFLLTNPIDLEEIKNCSIQILPSEYRTFFNNSIVITIVGRHSQEKNQIIALKSFLHLKSHRIKLLLIGDGPLTMAYKDFISKNSLTDRVLIVKHTTNIHMFVARSSFILNTSLYEGSPNWIKEAMVLGKFIISVPTKGGYIELVRGYKNQVLLNSFDPIEISSAINCKVKELGSINDDGNFSHSFHKFELTIVCKRLKEILKK